jgi:hypothetical protein
MVAVAKPWQKLNRHLIAAVDDPLASAPQSLRFLGRWVGTMLLDPLYDSGGLSLLFCNKLRTASIRRRKAMV